MSICDTMSARERMEDSPQTGWQDELLQLSNSINKSRQHFQTVLRAGQLASAPSIRQQLGGCRNRFESYAKIVDVRSAIRHEFYKTCKKPETAKRICRDHNLDICLTTKRGQQTKSHFLSERSCGEAIQMIERFKQEL